MPKQKERRTPTPVRESHSALKNKYYIFTRILYQKNIDLSRVFVKMVF